jgi:proline iminopeptidase
MDAHDRFLAFRRSLPRPPVRQTHRIAARGLDFAVWTTPDVPGATPLLCVNGGLLYAHNLLWPALSPLAARRRLVFYDQRGRGETAAPPGPRAARLEHDAGDIPAHRAALGIARWDILGHSWGGGVALLAAAQDQDGVRRVVTVDGVGPTSDWMPELRRAALARLAGAERAAVEQLGDEMLWSDDPALQESWSRAIYPAWFAEPSLARHFAPPPVRSVTGAAVAARLRREGYDWREPLRALRRPVLVIHGADDALPVAAAHALGATLPQARVVVLPGTGHMPFWEAPTSFFPTVETFLSEAMPPPPP